MSSPHLALGLLFLLAVPAWGRQAWVEAPVTRALPGQEALKAKTYFWDAFTTRKGTFKATYASMLDPRQSVTGTFLVAKCRYVYQDTLEASALLYPAHNEMILEVLLDCREHWSGTLATTYLLNGKVVQVESVPEQDVAMMQTSGPSTMTDLCAFAAGRR